MAFLETPAEQHVPFSLLLEWGHQFRLPVRALIPVGPVGDIAPEAGPKLGSKS